MSRPVDLAEIEARAKEAPIYLWDEANAGAYGGAVGMSVIFNERYLAYEALEYIAGMDPATTLALVAEVRALRAKVEAVEVMADEIEAGDWGRVWRDQNIHGAVRRTLRLAEEKAHECREE